MGKKQKKARIDCLKKAITRDGEVTITVVDASQLVQETMERIQSWPPATIHLGQAMMGAILLMAATDKADCQKIALQWDVNGPFGALYAESSELGHVRGTIALPQAPVKDLDAKLGAGTLQVRRVRQAAFTGVVPSTGDVSYDLVDYLEKSEQRRCGINFSVQIGWKEGKNPDFPFQVDGAFGYLIDVLPQVQDAEAKRVVKKWDEIMHSLGKISEWQMGEDPTHNMLRLLTGEREPEEILYQRIQFHCPCSKERAARALSLASKMEGQPAVGDAEEVRCEFCGKVYVVGKAT